MTAVDDSKNTDDPVDEAEPAADTSFDQGRRWYVAELLAMLELGGLAAFAFARPVLDAFGRSPDTFVARGADALTVVLFGVVIALTPYAVFGVLGLLGRPFGPAVRRRVHIVLVAIAGGFAVWQLGQGLTGYPPESQKLIIAGVVGGIAIGFLRASVASTASFLRFLGGASVIFLLQFLLMSPSSALISGGPTLDDDVARSVAADLGDDPPDVVMFVFDALPTASLLDGTGQVDAELYPNFARLAGTSTWYRNNTSVAAFTLQAVPAIVTGQLGARPAATGSEDENLFTLLGGSYEMHVREQITRLCPDEICPATTSGGLGTLLGDAVDTWIGSGEGSDDGEFHVPGALDDDRYLDAEQWVEGQQARTSRPQFQFHHIVMPHSPWIIAEDGQVYDGTDGVPVGATFGMTWSHSGIPVGIQRHTIQLQAADRILGQELDRLEADGRLDDALVVVTADHGNAFLPDEPQRAVSEGNLEQVIWAPLFVKAPGQTAGEVDDANVMSIDIVPTIAHMLGIDLPWDVDGIAADDPGQRRTDDVKLVEHNKNNLIVPEDGEDLVELDDTRPRFERMIASDLVEGTGPDGAWRRTVHGGLFGQEIADLTVGEPAGAEIEVDQLDAIEDSERRRPMAEVVGRTSLPRGTVIAYALNGTIGAVTAVEPGLDGDPGLAHGLLPPGRFRDGGNEVQAFVVEGAVGSEVLRPIDLTDAG